MMHPKSRKSLIVGAILIGLGGKAYADVPMPPPINLHIATPAHVLTDGGGSAYLPPGYYLDQDSYTKLDTEVKRLQNSETSLTAQNKSLQASVTSFPAWYTVAICIAGGIALGVIVDREASKL